MNGVVVDASALILAVAGKSNEAAELRWRLAEMSTHAPHLVDAEVGNVLRRHERGGLLAPQESLAGLRAARALVGVRYDHGGSLAEAAWALRHNLSFYDAIYVALAAALEVPLMTADARLTRAPHLPCALEPI